MFTYRDVDQNLGQQVILIKDSSIMIFEFDVISLTWIVMKPSLQNLHLTASYMKYWAYLMVKNWISGKKFCLIWILRKILSDMDPWPKIGLPLGQCLKIAVWNAHVVEHISLEYWSTIEILLSVIIPPPFMLNMSYYVFWTYMVLTCLFNSLRAKLF